MTGREVCVVAPDLGAGGRRLRQEEQIMHRHDLGRVSAGDEQRVRRVDDVSGDPERFDWRPLQSMPEVVQDADRHTPVHDVGAQFGRYPGRRTVLP